MLQGVIQSNLIVQEGDSSLTSCLIVSHITSGLHYSWVCVISHKSARFIQSNTTTSHIFLCDYTVPNKDYLTLSLQLIMIYHYLTIFYLKRSSTIQLFLLLKMSHYENIYVVQNYLANVFYCSSTISL